MYIENSVSYYSEISLIMKGKFRNNMNTQQAVANRIRELCKERGITPNGISIISGVPQATVKSILNGESKNPGIVTIKKLCDGVGITITEFFDTDYFKALEQEIK